MGHQTLNFAGLNGVFKPFDICSTSVDAVIGGISISVMQRFLNNKKHFELMSPFRHAFYVKMLSYTSGSDLASDLKAQSV